MSVKSKFVLATNNKHKLEELQFMLTEFADVLPLNEFTTEAPDETGLTFVENALIKARAAARASGLPALADDSGLVIPEFGGEPGLYSARYAGPGSSDQDNNQALVDKLNRLELPQVKAHYHSTIVLVRAADDPDPFIAQGRWEGVIKPQALGSQGFGYDPYFYIGPDFEVSAASLESQVKHEMSHRARAVQVPIQSLRLLQQGDPLLGTYS